MAAVKCRPKYFGVTPPPYPGYLGSARSQNSILATSSPMRIVSPSTCFSSDLSVNFTPDEDEFVSISLGRLAVSTYLPSTPTSDCGGDFHSRMSSNSLGSFSMSESFCDGKKSRQQHIPVITSPLAQDDKRLVTSPASPVMVGRRKIGSKDSSGYGSSGSASDLDDVKLDLSTASSTSSFNGLNDSEDPTVVEIHTDRTVKADRLEPVKPNNLNLNLDSYKPTLRSKSQQPVKEISVAQPCKTTIHLARQFGTVLAKQEKKRYRLERIMRLENIAELEKLLGEKDKLLVATVQQRLNDLRRRHLATNSTGSHSTTTDRIGDGPSHPQRRIRPRSALLEMQMNMSNPRTAQSSQPAQSHPKSITAVKDALVRWCAAMTRGYAHVNITNFSSSWCDGLAFCALIHHFYPDSFEFDQLDPVNRRRNFDLAFRVAEEKADVTPLLDTDDMIMMGNRPDWKCVYTYVQSLYKALRNK